jgi:hypothetical protein
LAVQRSEIVGLLQILMFTEEIFFLSSLTKWRPVCYVDGEVAVNGKLDKISDELVLFLIILEELRKSKFSGTNFEI